MLVSCLITIYLLLVFVCLVISFLRRKNDGSYLYLYFISVAVIEILPRIFVVEANRIYTFGSFLYIVFFTFYYSIKIPDQKRSVYILGLLASVFSLVFIVLSKQMFSTALGITLSVFYMTLSLMWFFSQIKNTDNTFITHKQAFWVSSAMLFWSVIFLFRISFMYWLAENDHDFLVFLDKIFKISVVLTYGLYLIAVTRKY